MTAAVGRIFDVRRFTLHDGEGLRTTFFMQGCPLRCIWCQNPEGIAADTTPMYLAPRCCSCNLCVQHGVLKLTGRKRMISPSWAANWDAAVEDCPTGALAACGSAYTVAEAVALAVKDKVFYRHGGGVTVSGGEPLAQAEFCLAFLQALRNEGIHTALESSLYAETALLERVLPHLDFLYADLKVFDDAKHRLYTGAGNAIIKENIKFALRAMGSERVIVRTPLIPSFTADRENIVSIADFLVEQESDVRYELLNYNSLAAAKYHHLNRKFCLADCVPYTAEQMAAMRSWARSRGIKNIVE